MRTDQLGYLTHNELYLLSSTGKAERYSHCRINKKEVKEQKQGGEKGEKGGGEGEGRGKVHVCQRSVLMKAKRGKKSESSCQSQKVRN